MNAPILNPFARPILRKRARMLEADDWAALREYARLLAREVPRTPYVPAPVSEEQFDADRARDDREWCR